MDDVSLILLLLGLVTGLSLVAVRARIAYPAAMVIAGLLIGVAVFVFPGFKGLSVRLDPKVLFTAILPPLLYSAAWYTSWNSFRRYLRPIVLLAIGGVVFTTTGIAAVAMGLIPALSWPVAFALGAIVSPPDAVAVAAITERLRIPKRITAILEGESLVNDASALVVYRFAVAAAVGGGFSLTAAVLKFPVVAGGGIVIGLMLAWVMHQIHERIEQPLIETAMTVLTPYAAYLLAERVETSGVLAVVACGVVLSRHSPHLFSPQTRLTAVAFWNFLTFILNGLVCILIGLQLPTILGSLQGSLGMSVIYAAVICAALIGLRLLWVFPGAYIPRLLAGVRKREEAPGWRQVFLVGWVGMRGVVSLAAALALPEKLPDGSAFPGRALVLFLTFGVILVTLVGQSVTLPWVIKGLRIEVPAGDWCEETEARRRALTAALGALGTEGDAHGSAVLRSMYAHRLEHLSDCQDGAGALGAEQELFRATIRAQRQTLVEMRDKGQISDELLRKLERELDLEESRLVV